MNALWQQRFICSSSSGGSSLSDSGDWLMEQEVMDRACATLMRPQPQVQCAVHAACGRCDLAAHVSTNRPVLRPAILPTLMLMIPTCNTPS